MSYFSDQAAQFQQLAQNIQTRLTNADASLDAATYTGLAKQRDGLLNQADAMIAADLKGTLAGLKLDQPRLAQCTADLNHAVKVAKMWTGVVNLAGAGLTLVTACMSGNPGAIFSALQCAEKAVAAVLPKAAPVIPLKPNVARPAAQPATISSIAAKAAPSPNKK